MSSAAHLAATPTTLGRRLTPDEPAEGRADASGSAVTAVHGFAQTLDCLGPLADALARRGRVILVDAPGHASSARHRDADIVRGASLLASSAGSGVLLGYSMGARLCLRSALDHPDDVTGVVLVSGTAGIADPAARAERAAQDHRRAERIESVGVEAFLEDWLAMDMFAGLEPWARFETERRRNTAAGLAASLRHAGTGSMAPLWDRLPELQVPLLCVTGERDVRYGELADRLVGGAGGDARHVRVPAAGHAVHLERPAACTAAVDAFLDEIDAGLAAGDR